MIREATYFDVPKIVKLTKDFSDDSGFTDVVGYDEEAVKAFALNIIDNENGIILLGSESILAGIVTEHPFNPASKTFVEFVWRAKDKEGLKLLKAAETFAKDKGASVFTMMGIDTMPDITKLYERQGYRKMETTFIKELG